MFLFVLHILLTFSFSFLPFAPSCVAKRKPWVSPENREVKEEGHKERINTPLPPFFPWQAYVSVLQTKFTVAAKPGRESTEQDIHVT